MELYAKREFPRGYQRHPCSLFRFLRKQSFSPKKPVKKKPYVSNPYDTPKKLGVKWQLDVQYVPSSCYVGKCPTNFPNIPSSMRQAANDSSMHFVSNPRIPRSNLSKGLSGILGIRQKSYKRTTALNLSIFKKQSGHPFDRFCQEKSIKHQLIRPRTPRHNGKVERSHRNDNERFYSRLSFYSYEDFLVQMKRYLYKSTTPHANFGVVDPHGKTYSMYGGCTRHT